MYLIEYRAPLLSPVTVEAALSIDQKAVMARVQDGRLEWAFDLRGRRARNSCLRIFAGSLAVAQGRAHPAQWPNLESVLREILPGDYDPTAARVACRFNCGSQHIYNLLDDGILQFAEGGTTRRGGVHGSARIGRRSLVEFLKVRRVLE